MEKNVRVRIAPSPTGYPHIGTIYQALFNFAFSKKHSGKFIVRIEDTDRTRFVEGAEEAIFDALDWFSLTEDESSRKGGNFGPYRQSERLPLYHKYTQELIDKGDAEFVYFNKDDAGKKKDYSAKAQSENVLSSTTQGEPPSNIEEMINGSNNNWVVKMKVPKDKTIIVDDVIRGKIEFKTSEINPQVLIKSDGFPTYHLAVVVDDHLMEISHVVRAEEWLTSFPKHKLLYDYFGWEMPPVYHTVTLRNSDRSKLSKRQGHTNIVWYKEQGFLPEAILNYLALLGWTHPEEKEIFSLDEFIDKFELKDIKPIPPIFDLVKLTWMNGEYIRKMDNSELEKRLIEFDPSISSIEDFRKYIESAKTRIKTLIDFKPMVEKNKNVQLTEDQKKLAERLRQDYVKMNSWDGASASGVTLSAMKDLDSSGKDVYTVLSGNPQGLPFDQRLEIQGRSGTIDWLEYLLSK